MPIRTLTAVGTDQTFACGQIVNEVILGNLDDAAQSARYRGETVINQTGRRFRTSENEVLLGVTDYIDQQTLFVSTDKNWEFENAGYDKWVMRIRFKLSTDSYNPGGSGAGYTRLQVKHTDKSGTQTTIWDSETASPLPTRGSEQALTIQGTFSNPPTGTDTELEAIQLVALSNASTDTNVVNTSWTGFKSLMFKLHD